MSTSQPEDGKIVVSPELPEPEGFSVHLGWIGGATVFVCAVVWGIVFWVTSTGGEHGHVNPSSLSSLSHGVRKDSVPRKTPHFASLQFRSLNGTRNRTTYNGRRAYPGAPPIVPHAIVEKNGHMTRCLSCHEKGGYTPQFKAYTPVTPHPQWSNCVQCHVPQRTKSLFRQVRWERIKPPKLGHSALPGAPPPIPHALQTRTNCFACHTGPAAVRRIRTPHPDRTNCLQCHVPQHKVSAFKSPFFVQELKRSISPSKRLGTKKK